MYKNKDKKRTFNKIEFDEKTSEPKIVEISEEELTSLEKEKVKEVKEADFFEHHKDPKQARKQIVMSHFGINTKEDENINKRQKTLKLLISIIFIVFVIGVLAYTFYKDFFANEQDFPSWKETKYILKVGWIFLLSAFFSLFMCYLAKALKLSVLCKSLTGKFHFKTCFETGIIGHYYNCVTPLAVGGQPFEIYHLSKHGVHGGVASSLPIATYTLNQFAFVINGILALTLFVGNKLDVPYVMYAYFPETFRVLAIIGLCLCLLLPILIIIFSLLPRFGAKVVHLVMFLGGKLKIVKTPKETEYKTVKNLIHNAQCLKKIFTRPLAAITCLLLSFVEQIAALSIAYFSLKTFGYTTVDTPPLLEWLQIAQLVTILNFAISFIPTPGNSGAADLSFYLLFASSLSAGMAFPAMTLWRFLAFYSYIVIGFVFATLKKRSDRKKEMYSDLPE